MSKRAGLASAVDNPPTKGVTTLASRFESPQPTQSETSTRVSDLASRFSNVSTSTPTPTKLPKPSIQKPASMATKPSLTTKPSLGTTPSLPSENLSKKVSDLQRAFSSTPSTTSSEFSARQSAFSKAGSESKVSAFARKLDSSDGPTERVAGVARTFESRDSGIGKPVFAPRLESVESGKGKMKKEKVHEKVDRFDVVASRFEKGTAGEKESAGEEETGGKARERFLDAAKRFGG